MNDFIRLRGMRALSDKARSNSGAKDARTPNASRHTSRAVPREAFGVCASLAPLLRLPRAGKLHQSTIASRAASPLFLRSRKVFSHRPLARGKDTAFSLVEVMCAILILGIGLVGLTQGVTAALSSNKESELQTAAALIASGQMETLRAEGYVAEGVTEGEVLPLYRWTQKVTPTAIDGLYEVEVSVEHAKTGRAIYELRTLLFDAPVTPSEETSRNNKDKSSTQRNKRNRA